MGRRGYVGVSTEKPSMPVILPSLPARLTASQLGDYPPAGAQPMLSQCSPVHRPCSADAQSMLSRYSPVLRTCSAGAQPSFARAHLVRTRAQPALRWCSPLVSPRSAGAQHCLSRCSPVLSPCSAGAHPCSASAQPCSAMLTKCADSAHAVLTRAQTPARSSSTVPEFARHHLGIGMRLKAVQPVRDGIASSILYTLDSRL